MTVTTTNHTHITHMQARLALRADGPATCGTCILCATYFAVERLKILCNESFLRPHSYFDGQQILNGEQAPSDTLNEYRYRHEILPRCIRYGIHAVRTTSYELTRLSPRGAHVQCPVHLVAIRIARIKYKCTILMLTQCMNGWRCGKADAVAFARLNFNFLACGQIHTTFFEIHVLFDIFHPFVLRLLAAFFPEKNMLPSMKLWHDRVSTLRLESNVRVTTSKIHTISKLNRQSRFNVANCFGLAFRSNFIGKMCIFGTCTSHSGLEHLIDFYALFSAHQHRCQQPLTVSMILFIKIVIDAEHFWFDTIATDKQQFVMQTQTRRLKGNVCPDV